MGIARRSFPGIPMLKRPLEADWFNHLRLQMGKLKPRESFKSEKESVAELR